MIDMKIALSGAAQPPNAGERYLQVEPEILRQAVAKGNCIGVAALIANATPNPVPVRTPEDRVVWRALGKRFVLPDVVEYDIELTSDGVVYAESW